MSICNCWYCQDTLNVSILFYILFYLQKKTLKNFSNPQACNFIKKETLAQVFSCEFCQISWNTFFTEGLWAAASEYSCRANVKQQ